MSHDQDAGGLTAHDMHERPRTPSHGPHPRIRKPGATGHPGRLERPSLFAGMEEDDVDDLDADRVGLLATLARGRERPKAGRSRAAVTKRHRARGPMPAGAAPWSSPWWGRALFALMAFGAIAVLYSFVQVVQQPHAMSARARAASTAGGASGPAMAAALDLHALEATAAGGPASALTPPSAPVEASAGTSFQDVAAMAGARIEVVAPAGTTPATPAAAPTPAPAPAPALTQAALVARAAADAARLNAPTTALAPPPTRTTLAREAGARPRGNDDVALLEAMMKHASARRAPPSSVEALQSCASLQGADAAVCKARACVQHPTAPQCHGDAP